MSRQAKLMGVGHSAAAAAQVAGDVASGLTATGTGQSDALPVGCAYNYVETVASGTGVRLYGQTGRPSSIGDEQTVYNAGASTLSVYPPSGEQIVGAVQDAAFSLPAGIGYTFKKIKNALWLSINGPSVSSVGRIIRKTRFAGDGLPNTETGAPWLRMEYDDPDCSSARAIDLSFYGFGQILRFTGDGTTANNSRSLLEFWGADQAGPLYRPIMTLVMSSTEHEVHLARDQSDVDAIICSYLPTEGPVIYTEAAQSAFLDLGVQRLRKVRVSTTNLNLVSGHTIGWTSSTTDPGGTVDIKLTRSAAGVLAMGTGDAAAGTQTTFKFNNGGFAAPGNANATSNGDKQIYWNTATLKVASGLDDATLWWQCNASIGTPVFKWFGGTSTAPALSMTLDQTAALKVVGGFGCNGATARTSAASGGALNAYGAGANGLDTGANMSALHALVVAMRAALVANGIMS